MELRSAAKPPYGEGELSSQRGSAAKGPTTSNEDGHQEHGISPARYKAAAQTEVEEYVPSQLLCQWQVAQT